LPIGGESHCVAAENGEEIARMTQTDRVEDPLAMMNAALGAPVSMVKKSRQRFCVDFACDPT